MKRRRVVITGIGPITPIGTTRDAFWSGLEQQRSAVRSLTRFDPSEFRSHNAAEVNDFVPTDHLDNKRAKRLDRFAQFSVVGAQMALADANLDLSKENRERVGANMGTALGGISYAEGQLAVYLTQG
ncbi:MAG TPA: beta-ketoacyl synthase N-terminal-like domain-containing protein, partial [Gemmatimonadaceae bacterium]|nr:beta-ketoacyl synthase N-terminal-like domain-containing protein [Gemmatimonadaceae bacterium]